MLYSSRYDGLTPPAAPQPPAESGPKRPATAPDLSPSARRGPDSHGLAPGLRRNLSPANPRGATELSPDLCGIGTNLGSASGSDARSGQTWTNSMPAMSQNTFQSAAWWPRFMTSWCGPPLRSHPFRHWRTPEAGRNWP